MTLNYNYDQVNYDQVNHYDQINNSRMFDRTKTNNNICIFGFNFHQWFCLCDLVNVDPNADMSLICDKCSSKFRSEFKCYLADNDDNIDFEDYLSVFLEEKMKHIRTFPLYEYECDLTEKQLELAERKFSKIYNNFMMESYDGARAAHVTK
jgi:hypothetical protein